MTSLNKTHVLALTLAAATISGVTGFLLGARQPAQTPSPSEPTKAAITSTRALSTSANPPVHIRRTGGAVTAWSALYLDPAERARLRRSAQLAWFREHNEANYERLLADLGVAPATRREVFEEILKIHQTKLEASATTSQLLEEQRAYGQRLRELLGENYARYADYERLRPAREESELIIAHTAEAGAAFQPEQVATLERLIDHAVAFSARTHGSLGGPQSPAPPQAFGDEAKALIERDQASLAVGAATVLRSAREAGFSAPQLAALESYYQKQIGYYDKVLSRAHVPTEADEARLAEQVATLRLTKPADDPVRRAMEASLATVRQRLTERSQR